MQCGRWRRYGVVLSAVTHQRLAKLSLLFSFVSILQEVNESYNTDCVFFGLIW